MQELMLIMNDYQESHQFRIEYSHTDESFNMYFTDKNQSILLNKNEYSEIEKEFYLNEIGYLLIVRDFMLCSFESGYYVLLFNFSGKLIDQTSFVRPYYSMADMDSLKWKNKKSLIITLLNNQKLYIRLISFFGYRKLIGLSL